MAIFSSVKSIFATMLSLLFLNSVVVQAADKTIRFSGYTWIVRPAETSGGPGPNAWDPNNVWVDSKGKLHLTITKRNGKWSCAELYTQKKLGFGRYQFRLNSRVDNLDANVVLGLFSYPEPSLGADGTHEIDIEFARWGNSAWPNLNYTVWPAKENLQEASQTYNFSLNGDYTTHRYTWGAKRILFQSFHGHYNGDRNQFAKWLYQPSNPKDHISQSPMPLHINLWSFEGKPPSNNKPVEVIISAFSYQPLNRAMGISKMNLPRLAFVIRLLPQSLAF